MKPFLIVLALFAALQAQAASRYIRAGATGAADGTSWADAWTTFGAATWTRGNTYYVAGGTYTEAVTINAAPSGSTLITVKKANEADNSGDAGWNSSYATTVWQINGSLTYGNTFITVDGVTGTNRSGHGLKIFSNTTAPMVNFDNDECRLIHCELVGRGFSAAADGQDGIYANDGNVKKLYVGYVWLHEVTRNGITLQSTIGTSVSDYGILVENSVIERTGGCTDPDIHGQGVQISFAAESAYHIYRANWFLNVVGSANIAFLGNGTHHHHQIYNNIFSTTNSTTYNSSPGVIWSHDTGTVATNISVWNNTFYNISKAQIAFDSPTVANNQNRNNLFENCEFTAAPTGIATTSNNGYYNNTGAGVPSGTPDQVNGGASTLSNPASGVFTLVEGGYAVGAGANLSASFTTDYASNTRTVPWSVGAYALVAAGPRIWTVTGSVNAVTVNAGTVTKP